MKTRLFVAALLGALALTAPAHASEAVWRVGQTYVVRYDNLNLDTLSGREQLLSRVERASMRLCRDVQPRARRMQCRANALEGAAALASPSIRQAVVLAAAERDWPQSAAR